jgi:serine/threonine protein kinase
MQQHHLMLTNIINKFKSSPQKIAAPVKAGGNKDAIKDAAVLPEWRPGDILLDRYQVEKVFSGAMGKVYIAEHLGWKIQVAIKAPRPEVLADPEGAKRVMNEADNWVRMGMHPNVATCFYVLNIDKIPFLFIEYVDGGDLSDWIKKGRCRDVRTVLSMAVQFCHGMEFTHAKGIIHRDIKPQNILLTKNALLKITDFGIIQTAGCTSANQKGLPINSSGQDTVGFRGTPGYASPEQFRDSHAVDRRTDIFSFGICLWLMLCGKKPYANNAMQEDPKPPRKMNKTKFPDILLKILKKTVAFDPAQRYQDFSSLRQDLNRAYIELFKISCPYMEINFSDLQAENLNNRAVSCLELERTNEAAGLLNKALDNNDILPEAIYNFTLLRWKSGRIKAECLLRQLDAIKLRLPKSNILEALTQAIKCEILGRAWDDGAEDDAPPSKPKNFYPEFMLCLPQNSLEVFRSGQAHQATQQNLKYLLKQKRYEACHEVLLKAWQGMGFRKDKIFIEVYEKLYPISDHGEIKGVIRLATLPAGDTTAQSLTYLPGPRKILSLSKSGRVALRHYGKQKKMSALGKFQGIKVTTLSADSNLLALSGSGQIKIISIADGGEPKSISSTGEVSALAISADNRYLSVGNTQGVINTFLISKGRQISAQKTGAGAIRSIIYFNKDLDFVTGSEDGSLRFWSAGGKECIRIVPAHAMPVISLSAAANGVFFISAAADRQIKIWDRQSGSCLKSIAAHEDQINAAITLPDNKHIISGSDDDISKIWQVKDGSCQYILDGRGDGIRSLAVGPKPYIFLAGRNDGAIVVWMIIYELAFD